MSTETPVISQLEKGIAEAESFLHTELAKLEKQRQELEKQRKEAKALYASSCDEAFSAAFAQTLEELDARTEAYSLQQKQQETDLNEARKELADLNRKHINILIRKGYDIGLKVKERKEELARIVHAADDAKKIAKQTITIPVRIRRTKPADYLDYEILEISYPHKTGNGLTKAFDDLVHEIFNRISGVEYSKGARKHKVVAPKREELQNGARFTLEVSREHNVEKVLNNELARTELAKANVEIKVYEEVGREELVLAVPDKAVAAEDKSGGILGIVAREIAQPGEKVSVWPTGDLSSSSEKDKTQEDVPEELLTIKQAAKEIGYFRDTVYKLVYANRLRSVKKGNRRLVPRSAIEEFRQGHAPAEAAVEAVSIEAEMPDIKTTVVIDGVPLLEAKQIQKACGYTGPTVVYKLGREGRLKRVESYGKTYFTQASFEEFWKKRQQRLSRKTRKKEAKRQKTQSRAIQKRKATMSTLSNRVQRCLLQGMDIDEITEKLGESIKGVALSAHHLGHYSRMFIKRNYNALNRIRHAKFPGVNGYERKDDIREQMLDNIDSALPKAKDLSALTLEGPNFQSYIEMAERFGIDPGRSVVAEKDSRSYLTMRSLIEHCDAIEGGEILKGLNLHHANLQDVVENFKPKAYKFDVVNLDYNGGLTSEKINTVNALFLNELLADNAVLFVTLNNSKLVQKRLKDGSVSLGKEYLDGLGTDDQRFIMHEVLTESAPAGNYRFKLLNAQEYKAKHTPMLHLAYSLEKARL